MDRTLTASTARGHQLATALRGTALLAVLAILWQGASAGGILMRSRTALELHQAGAIAVHVLTGLTALAAFGVWRLARGRLWVAVLATVVFAASFVQAALGDDATMWAHVPGALLLTVGSVVVLVRAWLPVTADR